METEEEVNKSKNIKGKAVAEKFEDEKMQDKMEKEKEEGNKSENRKGKTVAENIEDRRMQDKMEKEEAEYNKSENKKGKALAEKTEDDSMQITEGKRFELDRFDRSLQRKGPAQKKHWGRRRWTRRRGGNWRSGAFSFHRSAFPNQCLDVSGASWADGARIQQWDCNPGSAQWFWYFQGKNIKNGDRYKCIDSLHMKTDQGNPLVSWSCNGLWNQVWIVERQPGSNAMQIRNPRANRCIDVPWGTGNRGAKLQIWNCNGMAAQRWYLQKWR